MADTQSKLATLLEYITFSTRHSQQRRAELFANTTDPELLELFYDYNNIVNRQYNGRADAWNCVLLGRVVSEIKDGKVMDSDSTFEVMSTFIRRTAATV